MIHEIDLLLNNYFEEYSLPGIVILITQHEKVLYQNVRGYAALSPARIMTYDTLFDLASVTKVMATTQAIMKLVDDHALKLSDKVSTHFDRFKTHGKSDITIENLLTHTSGLMPWKPLYYHVDNPKDALRFLCDLPLTYQAHTERRYSDLNFMLLGHLIEAVCEQPLNVFLEKEIYQKLNMKNTMFVPRILKNKIAATSFGNPYEYKMIETKSPYPCDEKIDDFKKWRNYTLVGEVNDGNAFYTYQGIAGHAGLFSTAEDLSILGQCMLNGGSLGNITLYNEDTLQQFTQKQCFEYGYGWDVARKDSYMPQAAHHAFGHAGFTGTYVIFDKTHQLQLIILTNKQNAGLNQEGVYLNTHLLCKALSEIVYAELGTGK